MKPSSQTQYFEKKSYQLQPQPAPAPATQSYAPTPEVNKSPVVVYDHKHQQEMFNANIVDTTPVCTAISSVASSFTNMSLGDGRGVSSADNYSMNASPHSTTVTNIMNPSYPISSTLPSTGSASYMPQSTSSYVPPYSYTQANYSGVTGLPAYGQSFTTPISLPGMPPLTVSATLPTDTFSLPLQNSYSTHAYNAPNIATNESIGYHMDPNQPYSPHL